jgi:hypothetical protein
MENSWYESGEGSGFESNMSAAPSCVLDLLPCSITITGNIVLVIFYGILLGFAAKVISGNGDTLKLYDSIMLSLR